MLSGAAAERKDSSEREEGQSPPIQPSGTQPSGTQPSGAQPSGTQPSGMQSSLTKSTVHILPPKKRKPKPKTKGESTSPFTGPSTVQPSGSELSPDLSSETEPPLLQPSGTEPSISELSIVQPSGNEPSNVQPSGNDPVSVQSSGTEPLTVLSPGTKPSTKEPSNDQPLGTETSMNQTSGTEPSSVQPLGTKPPDSQPLGAQSPLVLGKAPAPMPSFTSQGPGSSRITSPIRGATFKARTTTPVEEMTWAKHKEETTCPIKLARLMDMEERHRNGTWDGIPRGMAIVMCSDGHERLRRIVADEAEKDTVNYHR